MMDKMKDMKTKKRTLKKEEKKESETEYVIRAENVDYTYEGSKIKALDHLSLNIRKGKKVAVMGGNGCGKSTFFLCLNILVMHPEVMILDEPAAALDMKHTKKVNEMIERLTEKGITVLIATHDIEYACGWADEIVLMHEGKVIRHAETMEICQDEEALKEAELEIPTVIRMYRKLTEKKILSDKEEPPRTWEELESRLT